MKLAKLTIDDMKNLSDKEALDFYNSLVDSFNNQELLSTASDKIIDTSSKLIVEQKEFIETQSKMINLLNRKSIIRFD